MPAKFKADSTFTIEGRGLVLGGEILEGVIKRGMTASILSWPSRLTISEVSLVPRSDRKPSDIGLVFAGRDEAELVRWRALDLKGQIIEIEDGDG
jgi:translation elongation factor EF-Tu-like GTPase